MNNNILKILINNRDCYLSSPYFKLLLIVAFFLFTSCVKQSEIYDADLRYTVKYDNDASIEEFFGESTERFRIYYKKEHTVRVIAHRDILKNGKIDWPYLELMYNLGKPVGWKPLPNKLDGELRLYKSKVSNFLVAVINNKYYSLLLIENGLTSDKNNYHLNKILKKSSFMK